MARRRDTGALVRLSKDGKNAVMMSTPEADKGKDVAKFGKEYDTIRNFYYSLSDNEIGKFKFGWESSID